MEDPILALPAGRQGHFKMESGYHSEWWFDLGSLFERPERLRPHVSELAKRLAVHRPEAVCGPMRGGAKLARLIAEELGIEYLFAERFEPLEQAGLFPVKYLVPPAMRERARGKAVAIVDDAISAGSAVRGTYADLLACGARPSAYGALFVFGDVAAQFAAQQGLPLEKIAQRPFGIWKAADCPLCQAGRPLEKAIE